MNEKLLQFIWQFQYYNRQELTTTLGETLSIIASGKHNLNQGPDFLDVNIQINNIRFAGNIELHVKASDWYKHHHQTDLQYNNVILHVVWENDANITTENGTSSPTLVLHDRVPKVLLERYTQLMQAANIPCHSNVAPRLSELGWHAWKERLVAERLERKSKKILAYLEATKQHWEEVFWIMLAGNFGIKVNTELFEAMAQTISVNILAKHKHQIHQIEALLLGQANLLNGSYSDYYAILLQKEYRFLQKKYQLQPVSIQPNFLRMRPANFPTIRLAQLAMLIVHSVHLFSKIKEQNDVASVKQLFNVTANDYWHTHYQFDTESDYLEKKLGATAIDNVLINTVIPVLFAYGLHIQDEAIKEKAIKWLMVVKKENNTIIKQWQQTHVAIVSAFDSQALIELTNNYCTQKRCLECAVGNSIFKNVE
jgi:hypothetical protein